MTRYEYEEWLRREQQMRRNAESILTHFDTDQLQRKPRSRTQQLRPSRHNRKPPES